MHINPSDKFTCCGCSACAHACPKQCITMRADTEGFSYPSINEEECVDCGLCLKKCPFHTSGEKKVPMKAYAAYNKNQDIRMESSSGGIFTLLAEKTIQEGGVVFGARYTKDFQVEICAADNKAQLQSFRGSKYVQASVGDSYKEAQEILKTGRKVLYSGTPCQILGLKRFLGKDFENLLTVDIICHGTPSPKVWQRYLDEIREEGNKAINSINFRSKPNGWKRFNFTLNYNEGDDTYSISSFFGQNPYMRAFLSDLILRPSCYQCKVKSVKSESDITLGDFWGIEKVHPQMDDDKGTSLILINTEKGEIALNLSETEYLPTEYDKAYPYNTALEQSSHPHPHRTRFFLKLDKAKSVSRLIDKELQPDFILRCKIKAHTLIMSLKNLTISQLRSKTGGG